MKITNKHLIRESKMITWKMYLFLTLAVIGLAVGSLILFQRQKISDLEERALTAPIRPDTVVKEVYKVDTVKASEARVPTRVIGYKEANLPLRERAEREEIVTLVEIEPKQVRIDRIDTLGYLVSDFYPIDLKETSSLKIDRRGHIKVKKKRKLVGLKIGAAVTGFVGAIVLANKLKKN